MFSKMRQKMRLFYEHHWEDFHFSRRMEWIAISKWFCIGRGDKICDIGCGKGFFTRKLAKIGRIVYGVDRNRVEIKKARNYNKVTNDRFIIADAERLPFKSKIFDSLVSISSLEHFNDGKNALRQMARILKPGHNLFLTVDSLSYEGVKSKYKKDHAVKYHVTNFYTLNKLKKKTTQDFLLEESRYILNSKVSIFFEKMHSRLGLSGIPLLLFFISHPISVVSDKFFGSSRGGCSLAVKLKRR